MQSLFRHGHLLKIGCEDVSRAHSRRRDKPRRDFSPIAFGSTECQLGNPKLEDVSDVSMAAIHYIYSPVVGVERVQIYDILY